MSSEVGTTPEAFFVITKQEVFFFLRRIFNL